MTPLENTTSGGAAELGRRCHPMCLVCGESRTDGLGLRFQRNSDSSVVAGFSCGVQFQGYPDRLHGGVVAMLLDAAMTHCLFSHGIAGVTAKLNIRYRRAVVVGQGAVVRARLVESKQRLYYVEASVLQADRVCAAAKGTFWEAAGGALAAEQNESAKP